MSRTRSPAENPLDDVQHFVMEGASWELYETLLRDIGNRLIRVTYDDGVMGIMEAIPEHEYWKKAIGRLIDMLTLLMAKPMRSFGSTTFRRKDLRKGLEPDGCYYFRDEEKMRGRRRIDLRRHPAPELAVEINIVRPSVPREPIYAAFGVPEIWRFDGARLRCLHLKAGEYVIRKRSLAFPFLEPAQLQQFLDRLEHEDDTSILKAFVAWVRKNGWAWLGI